MMKTRMTVLGALATVFAGLMFAGPAQAGGTSDFEKYPTCGGGGFCVWDGTDNGLITRFRTTVNDKWPAGVQNDDNWWRNNGYYEPGADHVRVYDASGTDAVTLCIHRGARGSSHESAATKAADDRGNYHRWGGECSSGEPQLN